MISTTMRMFYHMNLRPSQLDTIAELEALAGAKMISTTMHIFYHINLKPSQIDMVAELEALTGTKKSSAQPCASFVI